MIEHVHTVTLLPSFVPLLPVLWGWNIPSIFDMSFFKLCLYLLDFLVRACIKGFQPEWYISTLCDCTDIPFWLETLDIHGYTKLDATKG